MTMNTNKWFNLTKTSPSSYILDQLVDEIKSSNGACQLAKGQVRRLAFDNPGERLLVVDREGFVTLVELHPCPRYRKLGTVRSYTFIAFNPGNKVEILVGTIDGVIQIFKINGDIMDHCSLSGHKFPIIHSSAYRDYTLTASSKEVIIWNLSICTKIHQLRFSTTNVSLRKASFSFTGSIAVLYRDSALQVWEFKNLEKDTKIDPKTFGLRDVKDYEFTKDGRAMILAGSANIILILNTFKWDVIKRLELPNTLTSVKEFHVLPQPLDGGANKILAILFSSHSLHFLDISTSRLVPLTCKEPINGVGQFGISSNGRYMAYTDIAGSLRLEVTDNLLSLSHNPKKIVTAPSRPRSHGAKSHLKCVRRYIEDELDLERLLPILKEFGEYPGRHRPLIWASILQLPRNRSAYAALCNKIPRRVLMERILADYPLADRSKALFLATIVNCLVHWCALLSQSTFLPHLAFPFLVVFQGNHILAFEIVVYLLANYCQRWFEYHPLPPLNVLAILENVLSEADPLLLNIFCERGISSSEYVWPLLQTMMSEVLSGDEWLILWDHLFSSGRPSLFLMCSLAYSICSREIIMSQLHSDEDFRRFYRSQNHVRVADLLKVARRLDHSTSSHLHPDRYLRSKAFHLPKTGLYPLFLHDQYPKFLAEDSQLELRKLRRHDEEAMILRHEECRKLKILEEKRLRMERDMFLREIDAARIDELRRCHEVQICTEDHSLRNAHTCNDFKYHHHLPDNSKEFDVAIVDKVTDVQWKARNCQILQDEVHKLESEVQMLLEAVEPSS